MKRELQEEIKRIHEISYGVNYITESWLDKIFSSTKKIDDSKKADFVSTIDSLYLNLGNAIDNGGISEQKKNEMTFQKNVESLQISLNLLGYELPNYGVDGLFGPETANAVNKFFNDNSSLKIKSDKNVVATPEMLKTLMEKIKSKGFSSDDITKYVDNRTKNSVELSTFFGPLLEKIGAPKSDENIKFLMAWSQAEGKGGKNNPFNTTWKLDGSTSINSHGVKDYLSITDGIDATYKTLKHNRYRCIVNGLVNDIGADKISSCHSLKTWGTGDLVAKVLSGYESGASPKIKDIA